MGIGIDRATKPMLARLAGEIPVEGAWLYEPKWDGFRALVFKGLDDIEIISRDGRDFNRYFPELVPRLRSCLRGTCVIDGEITIVADGALDFGALLMRIHPAGSRVHKLAELTPASFVAFDVLAARDRDLRDQPALTRRRELERCVKADEDLVPGRSSVVLTPQTDRVEVARAWFDGLEDLGLDGIVAKPADLRYLPGERAMVKVKHTRTTDCVVGGYRLSKDGRGVGSLLLGLYDDLGTLQYVGHTSSFKAAERRRLLAELRPLEGGTSFGAGRAPGGPSRWSRGRDTSWVPLEPVRVCEVAFERMQGDRFRHAARFLRWRTDRDPRSCTFAQLGRTASA
jgi:ATP-dependent DNA ligase